MECLLVVFTVILIVVVWIYYYMTEKFKYFAKRGIPYLEPNNPLGSMWRSVLLLENMTESFDRVYRQNPGKGMLGVYQLTLPILMISDPQLINDILVKKFSCFNDRGFVENEDLNPLDNHLVNLVGAKWRTVRTKLSPTFSSGKLRGMLPLMEQCVDAFMETLPEKQEKEINHLFAPLAIQVVGSCAFGIDSDALKSDNSPFISACNKLSNPGFFIFMKTFLNVAFPRFSKAINLKIWPEELYRFFLDLVRDGFEIRRTKNIVRNDFLQILLELKDKGEIQKEEHHDDDKDNQVEITEQQEDSGTLVLDDMLLTAQAFVFFTAGNETISISLCLTTYYLSINQPAQDKARKQLREVKNKHGSFTYKSLKELVYLEACIKESLRLFPPISQLFRKCTKTVKLGDVTIDKDAVIMIPISAIHMDTVYFPNPEEFRPERFLEEECNPFVYLPFGEGPRKCLGQRFAMMEMTLALARLLDSYAVDPSSKMTDDPIELIPLSFLSSPKVGIQCILRKLKD